MKLGKVVSLLLAGSLLALTSEVLAQTATPNQPTSSAEHEFVYTGSSCDARTGTDVKPPVPRKLDEENEISRQNRAWSAEWIHWLMAYYFCLSAITILSGLAASNIIPDQGKLKYKSLCSLSAAIITAWLGAFSPQTRSEKFMRAWVYLNTAILTFENDDRMTMCDLVRAYGTAQIIARSNGVSLTGR